ncbi:GNAT family N-acetyltransferase [Brachybacterium sp. YJGR34]|uniref:GNAT family N-acetyltransferase n=1 Tax=Brachybacterium sp. YJGR34 TaxID=2059911 RepID=UPI000E0B29FD|nr:GNAT family N-acetyltransferase [Brachybacterium sp. YJGR34]
MTDQHPAPTPENQDVQVRDAPEQHRFEIHAEGRHAGFSVYHDLDDVTGTAQRIFHHTVVFDEFGGRGLAGTLTRRALEDSVAAGRRIVAVCPYVKKWVSTHHEFDDSLDPVRPQHLEALR